MSLEAAASSALLGKMISKLEELVRPDRIQKVRTVPLPARAVKSITNRVSITATKYPDEADISIENPWDEKARIIAISIIPNNTAKTNGQFKLKVQDVTLLSIDADADLTEYSSIPVVLPNEGIDIESRETVELFGKTSSGTSVFNLYVTFQRSA